MISRVGQRRGHPVLPSGGSKGPRVSLRHRSGHFPTADDALYDHAGCRGPREAVQTGVESGMESYLAPRAGLPTLFCVSARPLRRRRARNDGRGESVLLPKIYLPVLRQLEKNCTTFSTCARKMVLLRRGGDSTRSGSDCLCAKRRRAPDRTRAA